METMVIQELDRALVVIIVMAFLILVQTVIVVFGFHKLLKMLESLEEVSTSIVKHAKVVTGEVNAILPKITAYGRRLPELRRELLNFLQAGAETGKRVDQSVARALTVSRVRVRQADERIDVVLSGFSQQTFRLHRAVLHPTLRFSAFMHGLFSGLRRFIAGGPESPASYLPDTEDFV
jgi:hypothetical protein